MIFFIMFLYEYTTTSMNTCGSLLIFRRKLERPSIPSNWLNGSVLKTGWYEVGPSFDQCDQIGQFLKFLST